MNFPRLTSFAFRPVLIVLAGILVFPIVAQVLTGNRPTPMSGVQNVKASSPSASDTLRKNSTDTIAADKDSLSKAGSQDDLTAVIEYSSKDSLVFEEAGIAKLFGAGSIQYGTMNLTAGFIKLNTDSSLISANGVPDSLGKLVEKPVFKDDGGEYASKTMLYNFKSRKGIITQAVTQQGEGYVVGGITKKRSDDVMCMVDGKYTTCDNHEHPHFYLDLSRAKVKPGSYIVSGPAHLVMEDVDLPLFLPFGYFPFKGNYSSGFLMPTYGDEITRGFYLSNIGYYFAFNQYVDLALRADVYSKGSWGIKANSTYRKRYKYTGNLSASYVENVTGEKKLPDYSKAKDLRINWSHSQDSKANPYQTFSASVNFATSGYTRNDLTALANQRAFAENTKSSSINYTRRFAESPWSLSTSMTVNQNSRDSTLSVSLPGLSVSMSTIYPFKRKNLVGEERWYEKIRVGYSGRLTNSINGVKEYDFFQKSLVKDWKNGIQHSIPVSATFNVLNYINLNTSFSYNERWYSSSLNKFYDETNDKIVTDTAWGFNRVWDYTASASASTKLYGMYNLNPKIFGKFSQIRHVLTPDISFSYHPDFGQHRYGYVDDFSYVDKSGVKHDVTYNHYSNGLFGAPGRGKSGTISFSLDNNVEMKIKQETDTAINYKKVSLIDDFRIGASYNTAADSLRLSDISLSLRLKFGNKTISLSSSLNPYTYVLNSSGQPVKVNRTQWEKYHIPGRLSGTGTSLSYTFNNQSFEKLAALFTGKKVKSETGDKNDSKKTDEEGNEIAEPEKPGDPEAELYAPCKLPWSIGVSYSARYAQSTFNKKKLEYDYDLYQNLSLSGSLSLTDKWKLTASTSYNFDTKKLATMNCAISRDLHCWTMSANFSPIGPYKFYSFSIAVKSSLLEDLKYQQHQNPRDNYIWR